MEITVTAALDCATPNKKVAAANNDSFSIFIYEFKEEKEKLVAALETANQAVVSLEAEKLCWLETIKDLHQILDEQLGKEPQEMGIRTRVLAAALGARKALSEKPGWKVPKVGDKVRVIADPPYGIPVKRGDTYEVDSLGTYCAPMPESIPVNYDWRTGAHYGVSLKTPEGGIALCVPLSIVEPA